MLCVSYVLILTIYWCVHVGCDICVYNRDDPVCVKTEPENTIAGTCTVTSLFDYIVTTNLILFL